MIDKEIQYWAHMLDEAYSETLNERRMVGPTGAARYGGIDEIADMRHKLATGIVEFEFQKHGENGELVLRHAVGTTNENIISINDRRRLDPNYDENVESYERRSGFIIWFWDLEKNQVRCFNTNRFERIINYVETDNITQHGNIFIHRDEDTNNFTTEEATEISNEIISDIEHGNFNISDFVFDNVGRSTDIQTVSIISNNNHEPVLKMIINKHGSDNDVPYQLRINDLRRAIRERYNVNIKRVEVTGTFIFN